MFYRTADGHPLPHNPFKAVVSPRPIGWISTRGPTGDNLAPYSFFNAIADDPPQVMFAGGAKDSIANIRATGVFAVNVVAEEMLPQMNATSAILTPATDEFLHAGVAKAECQTIACPRVAQAPATLECRLNQIIPLLGDDNFIVLAEVIAVHLHDDCLTGGRFDVTLFHPAARLGYKDYTVVREVFAMNRPKG